MNTPDEEAELLGATRVLGRRIGVLSDHLQVSQKQARRTRLLTWVTMILTVISLVGVAVTTVLYQRVQDSIDANQHTQVVSCQNANESRSANLALWNFVLDISSAQQVPASRKQQLEEIRTWINQLFAPRDCNDLTRKYKIPAPPAITSLR